MEEEVFVPVNFLCCQFAEEVSWVSYHRFRHRILLERVYWLHAGVDEPVASRLELVMELQVASAAFFA